ncbi:MAG: glycosyltransferase [Prochlorococcaceae cyanobacterium]
MKILYLVHGHESFSVGGAENAAFSLFREAVSRTGHDAWILAAVHTSRGVLSHGELRSVEGTDREYLIGTACDWFRFSNAHIPSLRRGLQRLLEHIQPDIIHLQHYSHFGIDVIPLLQTLSPASRIVVTLHEYLALCMHNGQMVKTSQQKLCDKATPLACSLCYPERSAQDMFLRHHYISTILESCDALVSPSQFLIDRYRTCGIDHPLFVMIENGLPAAMGIDASVKQRRSYSSELNRFAFFGQLNLYKGTLLLLKAAYLLQESGITNFLIQLHGANLEHQPQPFQDEFELLHERVRDRVLLRGSYRQPEVKALMADADWMIIPSIWWENSPVVIQEAFANLLPIIGSDIGGTAEKISDRGGITFTAQSEASLASRIERCIGNRELHQGLVDQIRAPLSANDCFDQHLLLYSTMLASPTG